MHLLELDRWHRQFNSLYDRHNTMNQMNAPTVLIVDDDPQILDLYESFLSDNYAVKTALSGDEALIELDESVDVILLDRRMPDLSGDELLYAVRERDMNCRVAMVTAVRPDFDLVELGFDEYLVKPVSKSELLEVVGLLHERAEFDREIRDWLSLLSKKATLKRSKSPHELGESTEYAKLQSEIDDLQRHTDEDKRDMAQEQLEALFHDLDIESVISD